MKVGRLGSLPKNHLIIPGSNRRNAGPGKARGPVDPTAFKKTPRLPKLFFRISPQRRNHVFGSKSHEDFATRFGRIIQNRNVSLGLFFGEKPG